MVAGGASAASNHRKEMPGGVPRQRHRISGSRRNSLSALSLRIRVVQAWSRTPVPLTRHRIHAASTRGLLAALAPPATIRPPLRGVRRASARGRQFLPPRRMNRLQHDVHGIRRQADSAPSLRSLEACKAPNSRRLRRGCPSLKSAPLAAEPGPDWTARLRAPTLVSLLVSKMSKAPNSRCIVSGTGARAGTIIVAPRARPGT